MRNTFILILSILFFAGIAVKGNSTELDDLNHLSRDTIEYTYKDTVQKKENLLLVLPAVYYSPETRWGFGVAGIYNFYPNKKDTISPSSEIQLALSYTQNKQILAYLPVNLYWDEWKKVLEIELGYYDYIYPYFGLGDETKESAYEKYNSKYFRLQMDAFHRVDKTTFLGVRYWLDTPDIYKVKEEGLLDLNPVLGKTGGVISGIGPQIRLDRRNNLYSTSDGSYLNAVYQNFSSVIGSKYNFSRVRVDVRKYLKLKKMTLAGQLYSDITWGDVPFFQLARLGGTKRLRGFLEGRFIDKVSVIPQVETRFKLYKKIGGVAFFSTGTVAPKLVQVFNSEWKYAYGAGLRFTLDEEKQVKVRLDYAFTPEGTNFYFTIGEAF